MQVILLPALFMSCITIPLFSSKRGHVTEKHVLILGANMTCLGTKHLKFEGCSSTLYFTKMAEKMDIEDFFEEIDPDLLEYASTFRKCGFSSSVTVTIK